MKFDSLSVFIPAYNCEDIVVQSVLESYRLISKLCGSFELVIVNDNSTDKTSEKLLRLKKRYPHLKIINMKNGPTRRENLAQAMKKARYDVIFFQDVDLSVSLKYLPHLIGKIKRQGYDIAIGSRYKGPKPKQSLSRLFISRCYNLVLKLLFKSKLLDHQCGFKAFKKKVFVELMGGIGFDKTLKRGWFWDAELLIRAQRKRYTIYEMPVSWEAGNASTFNIGREIHMIPYIIKFYIEVMSSKPFCD